MFRKIVSNLSFSPQATGQLTYYLRRLRGESLTRQVSVAAGILLVVLQIGVSLQPASASKPPSSNDIIYGGLSAASPQSDLLGVYDQNQDSAGHTDYVALFNHFHIRRSDLAAATPTTINSSDHELLSLGRNANFAADTAVPVTGTGFSLTNPFPCDHHLIRQTDTGDCVKHLQWYLTSKFTYSDLINDNSGIDGVFGAATKEAVQKFQFDHHVSGSSCAVNWTTCDGIVGPSTWEAFHGPTNRSNTVTYYQRPLYLWIDNYEYPALTGTNSDGQQFWIMLDCGNIVVKNSIPTAPPIAPPPLAPPPPPTTKPPVLPPVVTPKTPNLTKSKSAVYLNRLVDGHPANANGTMANPGDTVEYTLTTTNSGTGAQIGYVTTEQVGDVLVYADITDYRGAVLSSDNVLSWPKQDILAGGQLANTFVIKIKDPVPSTPISPASPLSYDLRLDNIYGTAVSINVTPPPAKQIEAATTSLPATGASTGLAVTLAFIALSLYFYFRNRQLIKEVQILRVDHNPGV